MYDVEGFVSRYFPDYRVNNTGTDIAINCPFCDIRVGKADTKFHLQIHLDQAKQVVHCFRCDYANSWIGFAKAITGLSYWQVLSELYVKPKIRDSVRDAVSKKLLYVGTDSVIDEHSLPDDFQLLMTASDIHSHLSVAAKKYLISRGFDKQYWKYYNLGIADSVPYRVIIPIDRGYWQGRAIYPWMEPKYYNPSEPQDDVLFNVSALDMYDEIVICEGALSAMAVAKNAIALIGKNPTDAKMKRILESSVGTFYIVLEKNAFGSMQKLADTLSNNGRKVIIWRYENGDPADSSPFTASEYNFKTRISLMLNERK